MFAFGRVAQITLRSGTPSHKPIPSGAPMLLQVMILRKRTACFSASFINPSNVSGLPFSLDIGCSISGLLLGSRDYIECPGFPFQPNLQPLGQWQRVRQWVAALHRAELCLRREITHVRRGLIEDGLIRLSPGGLHLERRHPGHAELQKITTRHLEVLSM